MEKTPFTFERTVTVELSVETRRGYNTLELTTPSGRHSVTVDLGTDVMRARQIAEAFAANHGADLEQCGRFGELAEQQARSLLLARRVALEVLINDAAAIRLEAKDHFTLGNGLDACLAEINARTVTLAMELLEASPWPQVAPAKELFKASIDSLRCYDAGAVLGALGETLRLLQDILDECQDPDGSEE